MVRYRVGAMVWICKVVKQNNYFYWEGFAVYADVKSSLKSETGFQTPEQAADDIHPFFKRMNAVLVPEVNELTNSAPTDKAAKDFVTLQVGVVKDPHDN